MTITIALSSRLTFRGVFEIYGGERALVPRTTSYSDSIQPRKRQPPHDVFTTLAITGEQQTLMDVKGRATRSLYAPCQLDLVGGPERAGAPVLTTWQASRWSLEPLSSTNDV